MTTEAPGREDVDVAIVLAAGEGTRLRPLTAYRPKPMLPVAGRPVLEHVFDALIEGGISEIHVVVGYGGSRVQSYFGPAYRDRSIEYHTQSKQLGSGHALLQARSGVDEPFLVVNGDQVIDAETVSQVRTAHGDERATIAVVESDIANEYGAVRVSGNRITELVERPHEGRYRLVNAGVYAFEPAALESLAGEDTDEPITLLPELVSELIDDDHGVRAVTIESLWRDATYPWDLLSINRDLIARGRVSQPQREPNVYVAESARIHPDTSIVGPAVICADVVIEAGVVIGPNVTVGAGSTIGAGTVLRESVIDTGCRIGLNATAHQLVAGEDVVVGDGATVPRGPGSVVIDGTVHEDVELGAVLADRASLGGRAATVPGSLVGPDATVETGVVVNGTVGHDQRVVR